MNLREQAESDLAESLEDGENGFGLPVELITPDAVVINTRQSDNSTLYGQVFYNTKDVDADGIPIVVNRPFVALRRTSLSRIPLAGEKWIIKIPKNPKLADTLIPFALDESRPPESGQSLGIIKLYLRAVQQT
jgi:hypothetical protein